MKTYKFSKASLEAMIRMIFQDTLQAVAQIDYDALNNNQYAIVEEIEKAQEAQVKHVVDMVDQMDRNIASGPEAVIAHLKEVMKKTGIDIDETLEAKVHAQYRTLKEDTKSDEGEQDLGYISPGGSC